MGGTVFSAVYYRLVSAAVAAWGSPGGLEGLSGVMAGIRNRLSRNTSDLYELHLRRVFPGKDPGWYRDVLTENWKTHERNIFALFHMLRDDRERILERVSWRGRHHLETAIGNGKGVLLLVPHFGDERSLHVLLGMAGYQVHVITSRYSDMPEYAGRSRLEPGLRWNTMHFPGENPSWMYRTLLEGGIIHYGSTAYGGPGGTWITSFGLPVLVPSAPWKMWKRTGCTVLLASCSLTGDMGYELAFRPLDLPEDRDGFAGKVAAATEELARSNPGQYCWKNLAIRHRETNTIARTGIIPVDEADLERAAIPVDSDPENIRGLMDILPPRKACPSGGE